MINFGEQYSTRVKDEDIGKAGVFTLKLENNNNTFEINPTVAERTADFVITVRDNTLIDYELYKSLSFKVINMIYILLLNSLINTNFFDYVFHHPSILFHHPFHRFPFDHSDRCSRSWSGDKSVGTGASYHISKRRER